MLYFRWVEIKKLVNSSKTSRTMMIPCPFSKSIIPRRLHCTVTKSQHWPRANRGAKRQQKHPAMAVHSHQTLIEVPVRVFPTDIEAPLRNRPATKILMITEVAIKISTLQSFAIKKNRFSIASKRKTHPGRSNYRIKFGSQFEWSSIIKITIISFICSHLPPSQGGKYAGFGYQRDPMPKSQSQEVFDTTLSSLATVSFLNFMPDWGGKVNNVLIIWLHFCRDGICFQSEHRKLPTVPEKMCHAMGILLAKRYSTAYSIDCFLFDCRRFKKIYFFHIFII